MSDAPVSHPSPHRERVSLLVLLFGVSAAPIFWLGQLMLGYGISAIACYGGDHPTTIAAGSPLRMTLIAFDGIALIAALAGGVMSFTSWRLLKEEKAGDHRHAIDAGEGRARFMALWGVMSSLCFLVAIVFNAIGSVTVPLCVR